MKIIMSTFLVFYKKELTTIAFPKVCATRHWFCEMLIGTNLRKIWFKIKKFKMWNLRRNDTNKLTKQKETHRLRKLSYDCQEEVIENWGFSCTHCYI